MARLRAVTSPATFRPHSPVAATCTCPRHHPEFDVLWGMHCNDKTRRGEAGVVADFNLGFSEVYRFVWDPECDTDSATSGRRY